MHSLEIGYCSVNDYEAGRTQRLMPEDLIINELHVLMVSIKQVSDSEHQRKSPRSSSGKLACRELCQVYEIEKTDSGLYKVGFDVVDEDGELVWEVTSGTFKDGYWTDIEAGEDLGIDEEIVVGGYICGYEGPSDRDILEFFESQNLPQLVTV